MINLSILLVEGNNLKSNEVFVKAAGVSCSENLKNLILKLEPSAGIKIINPINFISILQKNGKVNWMM